MAVPVREQYHPRRGGAFTPPRAENSSHRHFGAFKLNRLGRTRTDLLSDSGPFAPSSNLGFHGCRVSVGTGDVISGVRGYLGIQFSSRASSSRVPFSPWNSHQVEVSLLFWPSFLSLEGTCLRERFVRYLSDSANISSSAVSGTPARQTSRLIRCTVCLSSLQQSASICFVRVCESTHGQDNADEGLRNLSYELTIQGDIVDRKRSRLYPISTRIRLFPYSDRSRSAALPVCRYRTLTY
ncbi:hypothetical protein OF83DRAFT_728926 [Amylostereum chailletii]|nr:hypothetical protein OF83DRAFT_728926 [Amylostereum chailletii]